MKTPTMHWILPYPKAMKKNGVTPAFCGIKYANHTTTKDKVTCLNCKKLMRLHGHLVEERTDLTRIQGKD